MTFSEEMSEKNVGDHHDEENKKNESLCFDRMKQEARSETQK